MPINKLIENKSDKAQVTVFVAGLIGLAKIIQGGGPVGSPGSYHSWVEDNKLLAEEYVEQLVESEKVEPGSLESPF